MDQYLMYKPAIVTVNYNRPDCSKRLLDSLADASYPCDDITLIISIDKSEKSKEIADIAHSFRWEHGKVIVVEHTDRIGLKKHVLSCGALSDKYGAIIVLEDDLIVSKNYYRFVSQALQEYGNNPNISGIALYSHFWNGYSNCFFSPQKSGFDVFFGQFSITWGQCWTNKQFKRFTNWLNENEVFVDNPKLPGDVKEWGEKSWGKYFFKYIVENNLFYVVPYESFSTNFSDLGEHNAISSPCHQVVLEHACSSRKYSFPNFENGIHYDACFDRILHNNDCIGSVNGSLIEVDFNHCKRICVGKKYLLTDTKYNKLRLVKSFGMSLRPIEANAFYDIPGNDIWLYELPNSEPFVLKNNRFTKRRLDYELYGFKWHLLVVAGVIKLFQKAWNKIKKAFK